MTANEAGTVLTCTNSDCGCRLRIEQPCPHSDTHDTSGALTSYRRPRWVTVSLIVVGLLILLFVIFHLASGGGMGRHALG